MGELVDKKHDFLTGTEGECLGVKYRWLRDENDHQQLMLNDNGREFVAWRGKLLTNFNRKDSYQALVRLAVKEHLMYKRAELELMEMRQRHA